MKIHQVARLLNDIGVETIATDTSLEEGHDLGENFYKLILNKDNNKWEFLFVQCKKKHGDENLVKSFDNEVEAIKFYYLYKLNDYFFHKYVQPFEKKNSDINIGNIHCNLDNLKETFKRLNIDNNYFSLFGEIRPHSISIMQVNKNESYVIFYGDNCRTIFETPVTDNWLTYYAMYKFVYYLYLLDDHCDTLICNNEITEKFTDDEYNVVLS